LKFEICGLDHKTCIYVENVMFSQIFETRYITVYTVGGKNM